MKWLTIKCPYRVGARAGDTSCWPPTRPGDGPGVGSAGASGGQWQLLASARGGQWQLLIDGQWQLLVRPGRQLLVRPGRQPYLVRPGRVYPAL